MNSSTQNLDAQTLRDARLLELLEHPELWPEDAATQAELAGLLELHLAMAAHGDALAPDLAPRRGWGRVMSSAWLPAAAAVLMILGPSAYAVHRMNDLRAQSADRARIDQTALKRAQDRAWGAFFDQAAGLVHDFEKKPPSCTRGEEDRRLERETAVALLEASHQLAAQGSPVTGAENTRTDLHAWLSEIALEDGCLSPERDKELRQYAMAKDLSGEAERMSLRLQSAQP
ncbi:MAG TPA: hypothetical protein VNV60_10895 [Holophagaceae bacterium]|jgi:hypothetical protein|nr:hypothetical protein [Holophagaceae bacterium]